MEEISTECCRELLGLAGMRPICVSGEIVSLCGLNETGSMNFEKVFELLRLSETKKGCGF
jgi:hypothetical protein